MRGGTPVWCGAKTTIKQKHHIEQAAGPHAKLYTLIQRNDSFILSSTMTSEEDLLKTLWEKNNAESETIWTWNNAMEELLSVLHQQEPKQVIQHRDYENLEQQRQKAL